MVRRHLPTRQRGAALLIFVILMVTATLTYLVNSLTSADIELKRQRKSEDALALARDALIGYALTYRDRQSALDLDSNGDNDQAMWGYLPMPDMGETFSKNANLTNPPCVGEGCTTLNKNPINQTHTYIGRFPWKTLGLPPLKDGNTECLWYVVSALHREPNQNVSTPMNWDTLGQLDLVTVAGAAEGLSAHQRPVAIIIAPGSSFKSRATAVDDVTNCRGNYIPGDFLEFTSLGPAPFNTSTAISGDTSATPKPISTRGKIPFPATAVANDIGLAITSDTLFDAFRRRTRFREDINNMLNNMASCLGTRLYNGAATNASATLPGRFPDLVADSCYDYATAETYSCLTTAGGVMDGGGEDSETNKDCFSDRINPRGYALHYQDQVFFKPPSGSLSVNGESCDAVLIFGNQRNSTQRRDGAEKNNAANYLEAPNLLTGTGFSGDTDFKKLTEQARDRDVVRCVKAQAPFIATQSTNLALPVGSPLVTVNAAKQSIDLGRTITTALPSAAANYLFGCAWQPQTHAMGNGLRSYFKFRINDLGTCSTATCIQEGLTFAIVDGDNNQVDACGGAAHHLGYSGNNQETPYIVQPKISLEIDPRTSRNAHPSLPNFFFDEVVSNTLLNGRNDPLSDQFNYRGGHFAINYWGGEAPIQISPQPTICVAPRISVAGQCVLPQEQDDNVHGHVEPANVPPYALSRPGFPPPPPNPNQPRNPDGSFVSPPKVDCPIGEQCGIFKLDPGRQQVPVNQDFHVRLELTRKPSEFAPVRARVATVAAIDLSSPGSTIDGVPLLIDDRVLVKNQTSHHQNGLYQWKGSSIPMVRTPDANSTTLLSGMVVESALGNLNARKLWRQAVVLTNLGTDAIRWSPLFVKVAAPSSINLTSPGAVIDGIRMKSGDRVLVLNTGIYIWNGAASAMSAASDIFNGTTTQVQQGTEASSWWRFDGTTWQRNATVRIASTNSIDKNNPTAATTQEVTTTQGVNLVSGDRMLLRAQANPAENGIYVWNGLATPMTRTSDADSALELSDKFVQVMEGIHAGRAFRQTALSAGGVINTDPISWSVIDPSPSPDFLIEAWILPHSTTTADQIAAMKNTTRPMSELYPGFIPHMRDTPRIPYPFRNVRLGFTTGQRTAVTDQNFTISNPATTWLE